MPVKVRNFLLIFIVFSTVLSYVPVNAQTQREVIRLALKDLQIDDFTLRGQYGSSGFTIPFDPDWKIDQDIEVNIIYSASSLLLEKRSTVTVLVNEVEITSFRPIPDGFEHTFTFTIPLARLQTPRAPGVVQVTPTPGGPRNPTGPVALTQPTGVDLRFDGFLRLSDQTCEENNNPGQWVTIRNVSTVALTVIPNVQTPLLRDIGNELARPTSYKEQPPIVFLLPDQADPTTLQTAGRVAARLGYTINSPLLPFSAATPSTLTEDLKKNANFVVVGQTQNLPMLSELAPKMSVGVKDNKFIGSDNQAVPPEHGVVQIFSSPWNPLRRVLVVSAGNEAGLTLIGQAFADQQTFTSIEANPVTFRFVQALETRKELLRPPWTSDRTTFAQLGVTEQIISGTGKIDTTLTFRRPAGWLLSNGAQLSLHIIFSPILSKSDSYVAIFINEEYLGTVRPGQALDKDTITLDLPVKTLNLTEQEERPQSLNLQLSVENYILSDACQPARPSSAWVRIGNDSAFVTPHSYLPMPDLQGFPYPFVSDRPLGPTSIVIPEKPTPEELAAGLSIASTLGRYAPVDPDLRLVTADQVTQAAYTNHQLIIVGEQKRQAGFDAFFKALPNFSASGLYTQSADPQYGILALINSPWNKERSVLLVYSPSATGYKLAANSLIDVTPPVTLPGSIALVEQGQLPKIIYREKTEAPKTSQAEPTQPTTAANTASTGDGEGPNTTTILMGGGLVVTGSLLAGGGLLMYRRWVKAHPTHPTPPASPKA